MGKANENGKQARISVSFYTTYSSKNGNPKVFDGTKVKGLQCDRLADNVSSIQSIFFKHTHSEN